MWKVQGANQVVEGDRGRKKKPQAARKDASLERQKEDVVGDEEGYHVFIPLLIESTETSFCR